MVGCRLILCGFGEIGNAIHGVFMARLTFGREDGLRGGEIVFQKLSSIR
jgi:hypothetical protein